MSIFFFFFFQAEDGIRDVERSRGLGDVYKRQGINAEYMGIKKSLEDKNVRQAVIELALAHIKQKKGFELSVRYSLPKMKYKGKTVQLQRIKGKKAPKIEEIPIQEKIAEKALDKMQKQPVIHTPEWKLFIIPKEAKDPTLEWAMKQIEEGSTLLEPFDGLNANGNEAHSLIFQISLPLLVHGHSIVLECSEEQLYLNVTNFYSLVLFLPCLIRKNEARSGFDCAKRILYVQLPLTPEHFSARVKDISSLSEEYLFDVVQNLSLIHI
eukprot:TRINITY_DN8333_c0_g1_i1.p1 TRINITY_DN8333_c0_g1~~TRINITY_DN8333_c0_g1_i1.p1  ORF type:complete len:267 (-),score=81.01 TRINITY_DN8333_c0_g1_i1:155-955(-)